MSPDVRERELHGGLREQQEAELWLLTRESGEVARATRRVLQAAAREDQGRVQERGSEREGRKEKEEKEEDVVQVQLARETDAACVQLGGRGEYAPRQTRPISS